LKSRLEAQDLETSKSWGDMFKDSEESGRCEEAQVELY